MELSPREKDKLLIFTAALLAEGQLLTRMELPVRACESFMRAAAIYDVRARRLQQRACGN